MGWDLSDLYVYVLHLALGWALLLTAPSSCPQTGFSPRPRPAPPNFHFADTSDWSGRRILLWRSTFSGYRSRNPARAATFLVSERQFLVVGGLGVLGGPKIQVDAPDF